MLQELEIKQTIFKAYGTIKPELEIWQTNNVVDKDGIRVEIVEEITTKEIVDYVKRNVQKALDYLERKERANRSCLVVGDFVKEIKGKVSILR